MTGADGVCGTATLPGPDLRTPYNAWALDAAPAVLEAAQAGSEMRLRQEAPRRKRTCIWLLCGPGAMRVEFHASPRATESCFTSKGARAQAGEVVCPRMPLPEGRPEQEAHAYLESPAFRWICSFPENVQGQVILKTAGLPSTDAGNAATIRVTVSKGPCPTWPGTLDGLAGHCPAMPGRRSSRRNRTTTWCLPCAPWRWTPSRI